MPGEPAVRVEALSRVFGTKVAVDALQFEVQAGELFGLVGPDGAGKTTTLRMLAGVLRPTSGDAQILGTSVRQDPEAVKHHIAYMSQRFGLYADLTVRENLEFYADLYRVPRGDRPLRMKRLFEFSGLEPFQGRLAGQLSGGMKQKLGLSCALVHEPRVLLLDEPTFGVDPVSRRQLWLIVHEMVGRGTTVIVSTSYMDEAERMDRVALLDEGRLVGIDRPETLQSGLAGTVFVVHLEDTRRGRAVLQELTGVRRVVVFGDSLHVTLEGDDVDVEALQTALRRAGLSFSEVSAIEPSMEDVFIESMTGEDTG
jgi:ABC-2 type transport system ATP-binding protein